MTGAAPRLIDCPAWNKLAALAERARVQHLRAQFGSDPERFRRFSIALPGLFLDYSKQRITAEIRDTLIRLAEERGLPQARAALFAGARVNGSEERAALHMALRATEEDNFKVDGKPVMPAVLSERSRMLEIAEGIRAGAWRGSTGERIATVVHIGIGGSDLGPRMVVDALRPVSRRDIALRFVSNVDPADLEEALRGLNPATTLFLIASKTFTTQETMANAAAARAWVVGALGEKAVPRHFIALSSNERLAAQFGIGPESVLRFWDWVGGRYSLWSSIGLPIAIAIGAAAFEELLAGAWEMDRHFRDTPLDRNMPVILGLLSVWAVGHQGAVAHAVLPYDQGLARLPAHLQQVEMESLGKSVTSDGKAVAWDTGPVIFGEPGTNGQHSFHQLLHQGTPVITTDFIVPARTHYGDRERHRLLLANALAQSQALMRGRTPDEAGAPQRAFSGNRPSSTLVLAAVTPRTLGMLIALYEHKVFVQGVLWGINPFDQWGVELGKELAGRLLPALEPGAGLEALAEEGEMDASTLGLLAKLRDWA